MAVAGDLPPPELAAQLLEGLQHVPDGPPTAVVSSSPSASAPISRGSAQVQAAEPIVQAATPQPEGPLLKLSSLEELVASMPKTETELRYDMRRYIRPIVFEPGKLIYEAAPGAPESLERRLLRYLPEATNRPWEVTIVDGEEGAPSLMEAQKQAEQYRSAMEQNHPAVVKAKELFPGVEIEFKDIEPTSNVISADFNKNEEPS